MAQKSTFEKRKDLLEEDYINGVVGVDGKVAIRPLNEEERAFLDKFNDEYVHANARGKKGEIHYELIKKSKRKVNKIKKEIKEISKKLRVLNNGYRLMNSEERRTYKEERRNLIARKSFLTEKLKEVDYLGNIRKNNYARSCDVSNFKKFVANIGDFSDKYFFKKAQIREVEFHNKKEASESELFELLEQNNAIS